MDVAGRRERRIPSGPAGIEASQMAQRKDNKLQSFIDICKIISNRNLHWFFISESLHNFSQVPHALITFSSGNFPENVIDVISHQNIQNHKSCDSDWYPKLCSWNQHAAIFSNAYQWKATPWRKLILQDSHLLQDGHHCHWHCVGWRSV